MSRSVRLPLAIATLICFAAPLRAQGHPLAGTWEIDFERGRRMEDGVATSIRGKARLTLDVRGDSLIGTFDTVADQGMPTGKTQRFAARVREGAVTFVVKSRTTLNINGEIQEHEASSTWTLDAKGDAMTGTLQREISGVESSFPATPVKGVRAQ